VGALVAQPVGEPLDPGHGKLVRRGQAHEERRGPSAHGGDVGKVLRGRLATDVVAAGVVPAEVPAVDEHVGARHHPTPGDAQHGAVVARAEQHTRVRAGAGEHRPGHTTIGTQPVEDARDESELANLRDRDVRLL